MRNIIINGFFSVLISSIFYVGCNTNDNHDRSDKEKQPTSSSNKTRILCNLPLTGDLAYYGKEVKNALEILQEKEASELVDFTYEDNLSNPTNAINIFNKYGENPDIPIIISCNSPLSKPLRPLALKNQKILLALVTGALDFGLENEWCFRDAINQTQEGIILGHFLFSEGKKKCASLYVNDDYGIGGYESFKKTFEESGGKVIANEQFTMSTTDMRNNIAKIFSFHPDFVFLVGRESSLINAINQIRERDKNILIVTSDAVESPNVIEKIRGNINNIYFASYFNNSDSPESKKFIAEYKNKYGTSPGIYAVDAFVAGSYLKTILSELPKPRTSISIKQKLTKMVYESPIKGNLFVNEKRDIISPCAVYTFTQSADKKLLYSENKKLENEAKPAR